MGFWRLVTEYFKGNNWRVHPDWVYCEYNGVNGGERDGDSQFDSPFRERDQDAFETPEEQVLHFLARAGRQGWKWMSVRPRSPQPYHFHNGAMPGGFYAAIPNSNQNSRKAEPYFCDRYLVQSLVRDAIVTDGLDKKKPHRAGKQDENTGFQRFGVTTSFVATRSGLLRWTDHKTGSEGSNEPHFIEDNVRAIDQSWYQRAVDQHNIEPDSFVYSVPFDSGYSGINNSVLVTATHAIFIEHRGHRAPAAVVGVQYQHETLARTFMNITSSCTIPTGKCTKTCASDELDCYLLDNNGFVLLSEKTEHTGLFFGQIDGTIMDSLVQDRIYRRVQMMDYQGLCSDKDNPYKAAGHVAHLALSRLLDHLVTLAFAWIPFLAAPTAGWPYQANYNDYNTDYDFTYEDYSEPGGGGGGGGGAGEDGVVKIANFDAVPTTPGIDSDQPSATTSSTASSTRPRTIPDPKNARVCDLKTDLYLLQPDRLNQSGQNNPLKGKLTNCHSSGCERPFSVQKIPHSNLILLVVDTLCPCGSKQLDIEPQEVTGGIGACGARKLAREKLPRKRSQKCINYHPEETEILQCAGAARLQSSLSCSFSLLFILVSYTSYSLAQQLLTYEA